MKATLFGLEVKRITVFNMPEHIDIDSEPVRTSVSEAYRLMGEVLGRDFTTAFVDGVRPAHGLQSTPRLEPPTIEAEYEVVS